MIIAFNPLKDGLNNPVAPLTLAPSDDIIFDIAGRNIWAHRGKFKGTDHTYAFTTDLYLTATNTDNGDDATTIKTEVNIAALRDALLSIWDITLDFTQFNLSTSWTDTNINLSTLSAGVYTININYDGVLYSGTFSLTTGQVNTDDEIPLHQCGNKSDDKGRVFAKIGAGTPAKLLIAGSKAQQRIIKFEIRIKQIGKL